MVRWPDLASTLGVAGAAIFLLMGVAHGAMTLLDLSRPRYFAPRDPQVIPILQRASIGLTPRANFWKAWLGFNLSHSLGLALFGGGLIYLTSADGWESARGTLTLAGVVVGAAYFIMAVRFWFRTPAILAAVGTVLFIASWLLGRVH